MTNRTPPTQAADPAPLDIGLLLCDHLDDDVAARVGDYTDLFPAVFEPAGLVLSVYDVTRGQFPHDLDAHDGWVVSGSRRSVYEDEGWIHQLEGLVRRLVERRTRVVGICFGHQMAAQALGGRVEQAAVGWGVGVKSFDVVDPAPWMDDVDDFTLLMSHRDQVTVLPEGAAVVATSEYCPVAAYRIDDLVFCVQGHPEWVPELSRILMGKRRAVIGADVVEDAMATLDHRIDSDRVAAWMARFFRGAG